MDFVFGWWCFDGGRRALINSATGQRLIFDGASHGDGPDDAPVLCFIYADEEVQASLVVRVPAARPNEYRRWLIDYVCPTAMWPGGRKTPSYGLWRRIDDCVVDALLCWPERPETGSKPNRIATAGGWVNGAWNDALRCEFEIRFLDQEVSGKPFVNRTLDPLDCSSPSPWVYHDAPRSEPAARLTGVSRVGKGYRYLPPDAPLTGFERDVPYLMRRGGDAVMFPSGLDSYFFRGEDYHPRMLVDYADSEVLLTVSCEPDWCYGRGETAWGFGLKHLCSPGIGLRSLDRFDPTTPHGLPLDLFTVGEFLGSPIPELSYRLWRRLSGAFVDGWLNWTAPARQMAEPPEWLARQPTKRREMDIPENNGVNLARRRGVTIKGGYVGGIMCSYRDQRAWMADREKRGSRVASASSRFFSSASVWGRRIWRAT
jgi:hypothetical protein